MNIVMAYGWKSCLMAGVVMLVACSSDDPAVPGLRLGMKAFTMESMIAGRTAHGVVTYQEVKAGVSKVELKTVVESEDPDQEAEFEGVFTVNLLAGSSDPAFGLANFSPGNYDNVEFKLSPVLPGGKTILIRFIHAQTQFELSTTREFELEVEGLSGLDLTDAGRAVNLLVLLDLDRLFAGITFDALVPDNDGVVRINDDANSGLLESILNNLDDACEAGEDRDKDGEIDGD